MTKKPLKYTEIKNKWNLIEIWLKLFRDLPCLPLCPPVSPIKTRKTYFCLEIFRCVFSYLIHLVPSASKFVYSSQRVGSDVEQLGYQGMIFSLTKLHRIIHKINILNPIIIFFTQLLLMKNSTCKFKFYG